MSACLLASSASAQTTTTTVNGGYGATLLRVDGETYLSNTMRPINARECDGKVELTFRITGLPGGGNNPKYIELWTGTSCQLTTRKDTTSGNNCKAIAHVETASGSEIPEFGISADLLCDAEGDRHLFFLGVDGLDQAGEVGNRYAAYTLPIDTTAPTAPRKVTGGQGETEIPINWKSSDTDVDHYLLVWDSSAAPGAGGATAGTSGTTGDAAVSGDDGGAALEDDPADCNSDLLMGGETLPGEEKDLPQDLGSKRINAKVHSANLSGSTLGSDLAAVGVIAVDLAGNPSPVSNLACLKVVPTTGFWDRYNMSGGKIEEGCACSLPGRTTSFAAAWPIGLALFMLALRAHRRRP